MEEHEVPVNQSGSIGRLLSVRNDAAGLSGSSPCSAASGDLPRVEAERDCF